MSINEITAKAKELKELKRFAEEIAAEIETLEDSLKSAMGETEELIAGEYKITYKTVNSSRFDSKSLKTELPEIAERYTLKTSYRRFVVA